MCLLMMLAVCCLCSSLQGLLTSRIAQLSIISRNALVHVYYPLTLKQTYCTYTHAQTHTRTHTWCTNTRPFNVKVFPVYKSFFSSKSNKVKQIFQNLLLHLWKHVYVRLILKSKFEILVCINICLYLSMFLRQTIKWTKQHQRFAALDLVFIQCCQIPLVQNPWSY